MAGTTTTGSAGQAVEEFELEELERKTAHLTHQWIARIVWDLEELGTGDLPVAAARAEQAARVLDVLERAFEGMERIRETIG